MSAPTAAERELIIKFRSKVKDILENEEQKSDHFLLRWIRAREGNLNKAEDMLKNSLKWRKENEISKALSKPLDPFIVENFSYYTEAHDHESHPVREVHVGSWNLKLAIDAGKEAEFQSFVNHFFESIMLKIHQSNDNKAKGEWPNTQFIYLVDWEGYSYSQLVHWKAVQSLLKFGSQYEAHYPEIVYKIYFVNCPSFLSLFMTLLKPLLATNTYAKIKVYGSNNKEEWQAELRKLTDPDLLWTRFGGNRKVD